MTTDLVIAPADILVVRGTGILARLILRATRGMVSHVGLIISLPPTLVLEALERVKTRPLALALQDCSHAWLLQPLSLTPEERSTIVDRAVTYSAVTYGYGKLFLQAANALTKTRFFTQHALTTMPICSYVVSAAYESIGKDFGQPKCCTTPADIYSFALTHPEHYRVTQIKGEYKL